MSRSQDIKDIAREASIAAGKNARVRPELLFHDITLILQRRLDSSAVVTHDTWFAWYPVPLDGGGWAWLRLISRRTETAAGWSEKWIETSYRRFA